MAPTINPASRLPQLTHSSAMAAATPPVICNYKISFHTRIPLKRALELLQQQAEISVKLEHNYAVIRPKSHVYSINFSGYVNITKLRTLEAIEPAIDAFCSMVNIPRLPYKYNIDNMTASGRFGSVLPLHRIREHLLDSNCPARFRYKPSRFCGANLKYFGYGTIIFFQSGAYTVVGAKCVENINHVYEQTRYLLLPLLQEGEACRQSSEK
jgi:Transcription factor TFIID (or TATA-binding protein, TBP)